MSESAWKAAGQNAWPFALGTYAGVLLVLLTGAQTDLTRPGKRAVEVALAALLLTAFASHPSVARVRRASGKSACWALLWPLVVLLVDAANPRHLALYPLASWKMFSAAVGDGERPFQLRYFASFEDGTSARLVPGRAVSDVVSSSLDGKLRALIVPLGTRVDHVPAVIAAALRGVARLEQSSEPARVIRAVRVERCEMPLVAPYAVGCTPVMTVRVAG